MATATLVGATVARDADRVQLTYEVVGTLPDQGSWLLTTTFTRGEDGPVHQFGLEVVDGRVVATFVFDFASATQHNYSDVVPQHTRGTWIVPFAIGGRDLGASGSWHADLAIDGHDAGRVTGSY
jgi:hypothetical protein